MTEFESESEFEFEFWSAIEGDRIGSNRDDNGLGKCGGVRLFLRRTKRPRIDRKSVV